MATLTIADLDNGKRDLQTVDEVANSRAATATTRFGQQTTTLYEAIRRINAAGDAQLAAQDALAREIIGNLGFRVPIEYTVDIEISDYQFTVIGPDGKVYAPLSAPFTTGVWDPDQWYVLQNELNDHKLLVFGGYDSASAAATTQPDGQVLIAEYDQNIYTVEGGALTDERPIVQVNDYAKIRGYDGRATRLKVLDITGGHWWVRRGSAPDNGGTALVDALGRSWEREFSGRVNVRWFGAGSTTDDLPLIQSAVNSHPGRIIYFPGGVYNLFGEVHIRADGTTIEGDGPGSTFIQQKSADVDSFKFWPTTAGSTSAFLNNVSIRGVNVSHSAVAAVSPGGAGIRFVQCSGYKLLNVTVNNAYEGITVQGGQFGSLKSFQIFASTGLVNAADTALLSFRQAPYGAGQYQACYTVQVEDFRMSASMLRETCIYIRNGDGVNFTDGYIAYGGNSLVKVRAERDNSYVSIVSFSGVYMDCVNASSTPLGVDIPDDGFPNSFVHDFRLDAGTTIGNGSGTGLRVRKSVGTLSLSNAAIRNMGKWAVDQEGVTTGLFINGSVIRNCGDATTGGVRAAGGKTLNLTGVSFVGVRNVCVNATGAWDQGTITGCSNDSDIADLSYNATWTYGLALGGNASRYPAPGNSWKTASTILVSAGLDFPSMSGGGSANLTVPVTGARVGDVVTVGPSGATSVVNTGTAQVLFVGGVTSLGVVTVKAVNLGTAAADPVSMTFKIAVHKAT